VFIGVVKNALPEMAEFHSVAARPMAVLSLAEKSVEILKSRVELPSADHFPIVHDPDGSGDED
jgi:hypothetical protein